MTTTQPDGYLALPDNGSGRPVLVLHAWWGLNDTIKALCDRLAEAGFVAFAPDLYHGRLADTIEGAQALSGALDADQARADVAEAARYLSENHDPDGRGLAVIGWLMWLASRGRFSTAYNSPVELTGLYWHFVDVVWIFLFPLFYLIGGAGH